MPIDDSSRIPARVLSDLQQDPASGRRGAPPNFGHDIVPHIFTVSGRHGVASRAYVNMDEALRDSPRNAERMRADCGIMECLEARQRATALLPWSIEPEQEGDDSQRQLAAAVTDIIMRTPRFTELRRNLLEALWYGRYAVAKQYGRKQIGGKWRTAVSRWEPRHGDKLVFRYDDGSFQYNPEQIGIRVSTAFPGQRYVRDPVTGQPTSKIQPTEQGLVYWMDRYERETMLVHKHQIEDGPWGDPLMAGRIHGVGIRDRIYWTWYAMIECLQRVVEYLDRSAFGIEVWPYQAGNPQAKADTEAAASEAMGGGRTIILAPLPVDEQPEKYLPHLIEPGLGGINTTIDIIRTYFGHKIKRYILGQTLTSEAEATGLGSGVADAHLATFADIVEYDAGNLEETLTEDFVRIVQKWNFPGTDHIRLNFRINTEAPNVQQKMASFKSAWEMGLKLKSAEIYDVIGAAIPDVNDDVLQNPSVQQAMQDSIRQPGAAPRPMILDTEKFVQSIVQRMQGRQFAA